MPLDQAWTWPQPQLISAALALSAGRYETCAAALDAADGLLQRCPADQQATSRLTAAVIRLTASLRTGDLTAAATAASRAELMLSGVPDGRLARHPDLSRRVLSGRAAVELWSGQPFVIERGWLGPVFRRDPELARTHWRLLAPALGHEQLSAPERPSDQAPVLMIEPLTDREREVLVHVSGLLNTAEVASEMYISVNTVKTHLRNIYRKLAAAHRSEAVRRARQLKLI
jgi:LuxR family maltose regulon positive regulatory protein